VVKVDFFTPRPRMMMLSMLLAFFGTTAGHLLFQGCRLIFLFYFYLVMCSRVIFGITCDIGVFLQGRTKITINLCEDGMLHLPQFVSGRFTAAGGFLFIF